MVDYTFGIVLNTFQPETLKTHTISGKRGHKKLPVYQIQLIKQQVMSTFPAVTEYDWAGIMERLTLKLNHRNKLAKYKEKVIN